MYHVYYENKLILVRSINTPYVIPELWLYQNLVCRQNFGWMGHSAKHYSTKYLKFLKKYYMKFAQKFLKIFKKISKN